MLAALERQVLTLKRESSILKAEVERIERKTEECKNGFYRLRKILQNTKKADKE